MGRLSRRWIAAALLAAMMPLSVLASICAAHCPPHEAGEALTVTVDASTQPDDGASAPDAGCVAASLCAFASSPPIASSPPSCGVLLLAQSSPHGPGALALPAEPSPPPVPPRTPAAAA